MHGMKNNEILYHPLFSNVQKYYYYFYEGKIILNEHANVTKIEVSFLHAFHATSDTIFASKYIIGTSHSCHTYIK